MKRKKWVNKVIALLLAAIMIVPSSLGTVAYAQEPEVSSEQTQTIQNADENISEASEQETTDASQKEQEKKETQDTQGTESKETQKEDSYEVKLSKADNGLLSFPISEDDLVKADVENSTQSILDASEEDVEYESKDSYEENTEVKVQTSADYGYELDKVELEDKSGEVLQELSVDEEGIATFTMPEENVKVAATFKEIPESVIEDAEIDLQTTASDYEIATRAAGTKSIYLNVPGNKIWYGRYNTRYYTTNEGQVAYCMNPLLKTPGAGWYTGSLISDGSSRKAFYYAYGGPGYSQFVNRYGWIWNGVRDLEYAYSHVILSYTYAKYALHNNSQANYAFYGLPNSTKNHLINKANQMLAMGGIPSGYSVYYFNTSYNHQPMAFQVNNVATLSLRKSSSNTDITNGNSCYSLANAKYGVYSNAACTSQISTFTTNANGTSNSINLEPGTYYVKEISAPEGYYIDNTVKTVSLSSGENKVVSFTDKPMDDPAAIVIQKKDKYTGNTIKGKKTLAGAQFTIKYYDGFYDRNNLPARATRTWVIETKERTRSNGSKVYQAGLSDTYKVGGDNFYKVDGAITIPRGTITIQETKAPDGYRNDLNMTDTKGNSTVNGVYLAQVTKPGDLSTLMGGQTFEGSDSPVRSDIKLTKINGTNNNTMANIPFKITNLETKESHTIYTGSNGVYDSSLIKKSLNTNTDKAGAGVWFGDTSILSDDEGSFEYGSYSIEELDCKENDGKILYKGTFKIDNNTGATLDLGKIINNSIEVKTYAADNTSGNNNTAFIQQGGIFNYTTGQLTYGKAITDEVNVKGISSGYAVANLVDMETGEYIKNKDGSTVQSEAKIEPYNDGTYTGQAHQNLVYDNPESMLGKNIVVFEKIYALNADGTPNYNKLLVEHTDMNDDLQTVKFQKISTELTVSDTGLHEVNTTSKDVTLQDQITYENFSKDLVDLGYYIKATAKLVDENGNAITDANGKEITSGFSAKKFTSDMLKNGDTIHYTLPASVVKKYAGKKLISQVEIYFAFDTDTTNGDPWNLWTYEKDTTNEKQTVTIPAITNTYVSADNVSYTDRDTNMNKMFSYCKGLTKLDVSGLDTSQVTDMDAMFAACINLTNIPVSNFNTSKVKDMHSMFDSCFKLQSLDLSMFDTSNVTDFGYMFSGDKVMSTLHLTDNFVTEKAKDISGIFNDCEKLSNLDLSKWNVSNVTSMEKAFANNYLIKSLNLSNWDTSNCKNSQMMFYNNTALTSIGNTSNWNVSKITTTHSMFEGCSKLQSLETSTWVFSSLTNADSMFNNCQSLSKLDVSNFWMGNCTDIEYMFNSCYALTSLNVSNWDVSKVTGMNATFSTCKNLTSLDVSKWQTSSLKQAVNMFMSDAKLTQVAVQNWDMSSVEDLSGMFVYCSSITSMDVSNWYMPNCKHFINVFNGLTNCKTLKIKGMYAPTATSWGNAFLDMKSLTSLDLSGIDVSKVTSFEGTFGRMDKITTIDLSGWKTSSATITTNMFTTDRNLKTIYVSENMNVSKVTNDAYMFSTCTSIRGGSGKTYNRNQSGKSMANYSNGYLTYKAYTAKANIAAPSSSVIISSAKATDGLTVEEILNNDSAFTDPIGPVNEESTDAENEEVDAQNADVVVQSLDDPSGKLLYSHSDLNDENETFYVPKVQTVLTNTANDHYFTTAAGSTLVDTVTYSGLKPGRAYTLTGKLMDKDTGKAATDKFGKEITGTTTFTPSTANGTAKVNFSFDGSNLKGKTLVAYETLNGISVAYGIASSKKDLAIHKDISDADQSVTNMSLSTTAKDQKSGTKQVTLSRTAKIDDTVSYKGAIRGTSYKINGTLMNKSTGEAAVDGDGKPITASGVFTAGSATGTATVTFTFNTNGMAGGAYVAFEEVYETTGGTETLWGTHMDLNDEAQTVYVPSISTNLIDEDSQTNYTYIRDNVKAHDLVTYEGLIAGKTYKLTGTLVEKSTGKTFVDANGKTATITQTFTPDSDSGSVDMVFDINPSNLKTSALVAFETLSCNGEQVTIENDLDNEQQTLHFPILSTTAKGKVSGKNYVDIGGDMSIIDTIKYEGVQYGMTHTIKTYLVDKSTGKTVKDDNGNDIVKTTEWEPEATQGSIDIEIPVTGKKLAGRTLVVFEEIYLGDAMIACHKDINDANQTIKVKGYRDCTVIKRIKADDYWKEHGDPTFIFKLTGTDTLGASHTYYQSVTFTESYVKAHTDSDGYVEMKAIFGQVPAGEYTCSEESVSRFEFESLTKPVNATINGKTAVYHLTDNDTACATFTNKKYEEGDFGHDSVVVNHFNHKTQD